MKILVLNSRQSVAVEKEQELSKGRRKRSPAFKAKVAPAGVKNQETVADLAASMKFSPGKIQSWKKALTEGATKPHSL